MFVTSNFNRDRTRSRHTLLTAIRHLQNDHHFGFVTLGQYIDDRSMGIDVYSKENVRPPDTDWFDPRDYHDDRNDSPI